MRPVKICIMATVPVSIISFYGKQIDYLKEQGFEVTVITSSDNDLVKKIPASCKLVLIPMSRQITPLKDLTSLFQIAKEIKKGKFDIIQYSSPKAALLGSICGYFFSVPARLYLMWGIYYVGQRGWKRKLLKLIEKVICCFSTQVSPDSKGNYAFALEEGLCPASKMSVVGNGSANGVDLERFNSQRLKTAGSAIRESLGIPPDAVVVGFVGRLLRDKGINELVKAFVGLSDKYQKLYLLLVGPREDKENAYEPEVNKTLLQEKRVISIGFNERPEEYMAAMNIFALPSYREGFGIANIEASAMELPVISTDIPGPRDSVLDGRTGILVSVKNVAQLQQAIERLYNDPTLRYDIGQEGRLWAKNFEQKQIWRQIITHRLSLLQNSPETLSLELKRILDVIFALISLVLVLPLMLVVGILVLINMGWPVFFIQQRPGYREKMFNIIKFRTMSNAKGKERPLIQDAERITPLGRLLRKTSLDEIPELFNVLKGDMSLVGPRPLLPQYLSRYTPEQSRRHKVKPGITGWAQVNGRNAINWEAKFTFDVWYVDNRNAWLDIKIILLTMYRIVSREGISHPGYATAGEFMGNERKYEKQVQKLEISGH